MSGVAGSARRLLAVVVAVAVATAGLVSVSVVNAPMSRAALISSWSADQALSEPVYSYGQQVGLSIDGTRATVVWSHNNGTNWIVQSASATISGQTATWGAVTNLSAGGGDSDDPQLSVSADGTKATAVWYRGNGTHTIVQSKSATISGNTATWGPVSELSAAGEDGSEPQIGMSKDGTKATVVWWRNSGSDRLVQSASATINGTAATWGSVTDLSATGQSANDPRVGVSANGEKATAVWKTDDGSNTLAQSASATISGNTATWGSVTGLTDTGLNAEEPQVSLSADGEKATAVWTRDDGSHTRIQSKSATISGHTATWGTVTTLSDAGKNATEPEVSVSAAATTAVVVWRFEAVGGFPAQVFIQSKSATISGNTATWGAKTDISDGGQPADHARVALTPNGTIATAVWSRYDGTENEVQSASATISGTTTTWGTVSDLSPDGEAGSDPELGLSANGEAATAVWYNYDGTNEIVKTASGGNAQTFPNPVIESITPNSGPSAGGNEIIIKGHYLEFTTSVTIGGVACTGLTWDWLKHELRCVVPASAKPGAADVVVTTTTGSTTTTGGYTYEGSDVVTAPPGKPRNVKVRGGGTAKKTTISWLRPKDKGGNPVQWYQLKLNRVGCKPLIVNKRLASSATSYSFSRKFLLKHSRCSKASSRGDIVSGKIQFRVRIEAANSAGNGSVVTRRFAIVR